MRKLITLVFIGALTAGTVSAQRLKTEDFNYSVGQLTSGGSGGNVSGGNWISNSGTAKYIQVLAGSLTYPNYNTNPAPNSAHILLDSVKGSAEDIYTDFDSVTSGTLYASFLLNVAINDQLVAHDSVATANYFAAFLSGTSTSSYTARLAIRRGAAVGTYNLGISSQSYKNTAIVWAPADYALNTTNLVTIGYTFIAGDSTDICKLWVNPANVAVEPAPLASSVYNAKESKNGLARLAFRQDDDGARGSTPKAQIDAIKISTSWSDATLPLSLTSFSVVNKNGYAGLNWQTCNEINVKQFEIQKSQDARTFTVIANVPAKNAGCATTYSFTDGKALAGIAYYRIKTIDNNGASIYSGIVSINGKTTVNINVFPNPVANSLVLSHPKAGANASMQVISMDGRPVALTTIQQDAIQTSIDISKLAKGNYFVVFTNGTDKQSLKFVKQ